MAGIGGVNNFDYMARLTDTINVLKKNSALLDELKETGTISSPIVQANMIQSSSAASSLVGFGSNPLLQMNMLVMSHLNQTWITGLQKAQEAYAGKFGFDWSYNQVDEEA